MVTAAILSAVVPLLVLCGCNIFGWMTEEDAGLGHLAKGQKLLREGNYQEAEAELALAIEKDPYSSEARYYHSKALVLAAGIDVVWVVDQLDQPESQRGQTPLPIYSPDPEVPLEEDIVNKNSIYRANLGVRQDLTWVFDGRASGQFKRDDIVVDLSIATLLSAILGLRDSDQDGDIDGDDILLQIIPHDGGYEILGLDDFRDSPEAINAMIDFVVDLSEESSELIEDVLSGVGSELDFGEIDNLNDDLDDTVEKYRYNDGVDNDQDGQIDEEALDDIDNDGDGLTDEDTHA